MQIAYATFTLNGFEDQERNLKFVKTDFQVSKFKFHACIMKQAFYLLHKQYAARAWKQESTFLQTFHSVSGCQTCMYKRDIRYKPDQWPSPRLINSIRTVHQPSEQ